MLQPARRTRSVETRDALLAAAAEEFLERGFHGASARQIAERAGFTNPVLYYHFGGKEALYEAVIQGAFERFREMVREGLEKAPDATAGVHALASAYLRFAMDDPVRLRVLYAECFRPLAGDAADPFAGLRAWLIEQVEALLHGGIAAGAFVIADVPLARRLLMALLHGLLLEQARDPSVPVLEDSLADQVVRTFLHGIARVSGADR